MIKRIAAMIVAFTLLFVAMLLAVWYCIWCFFWAFFVWLISKTTNHHDPLQYEQSVGFVFFTFFPVILVSYILLFVGFSFPFSMTLLFLAAFGYNHLSFAKTQDTLSQ